VDVDLDPIMVSLDHQLALVVEVSRRAGGVMADEYVAPLGGTDGDVPTGNVDAQLNRLVEINGDTILSPSFGVSRVHHDLSSQGWWIPRSGGMNGGRGAANHSAMISTR
jgi:hypothetical protein